MYFKQCNSFLDWLSSYSQKFVFRAGRTTWLLPRLVSEHCYLVGQRFWVDMANVEYQKDFLFHWERQQRFWRSGEVIWKKYEHEKKRIYMRTKEQSFCHSESLTRAVGRSSNCQPLGEGGLTPPKTCFADRKYSCLKYLWQSNKCSPISINL